MTQKDYLRPEFVILLIAGLAVYVIGMFGNVFIDASKYAAISKNIAETGNLLHFRIMGEPYLQKPPFMFWLAALSFKIFGISNFSYKLPTLLFFFAGIYATFRFGELYHGTRTGLLAAFLFAFSQAMFLFNSDVHTDTLLSMLVILSIWQISRFLVYGKSTSYFLGFLFAGLALITKGPVGILVPLFAIGGHLFIKKAYGTIFNYKWLPGFLLVVLIAFPALKGLYDQFGFEGLKFFFWTNNAGRISGSYAGNSRDYFFYLHTLLYLFLPWSFFTFFCFYQDLRELIRHKFKTGDSREYICWSGILIFVAILSVARMKGPHYMLPVLPLISVITARGLIRLASSPDARKQFRLTLKLQKALSVLLVILAILIPVLVFPDQGWIIWTGLSLLTGFFMYVLFNNKGEGTYRFLLFSSVAIVTLNYSINAVFYPGLNEFNAAAKASEIFNRYSTDKEYLYTYQYRSHETAFYAKNGSLPVTNENRARLFSTGGNWIFTTKPGLDSIKRQGHTYLMIDTLPYLKMSNINPGYLGPLSRNQIAKETYLIQTQPLSSRK